MQRMCRALGIAHQLRNMLDDFCINKYMSESLLSTQLARHDVVQVDFA